MGVKVRQKIKGEHSPWWVFIARKGERTSKLVGDRKAAEIVASKIRERLSHSDLTKPKIINEEEISELINKILFIVKKEVPDIPTSSWHRIKQKILRERLEDSYLKELLNRQSIFPIQRQDIPPELIELKRNQIKEFRLIQQLEEDMKNDYHQQKRL